MNKVVALSVVGLSLLLGGCAEDISPNTYSSKDVGQLSKVVPATIVSMRPVIISTNTGVGGLVGVGAGAIAGSAIGGGTRANMLGGLGGALVGGLAGNAIEKGIGKKHGVEYVLRTNSGNLLTVTQLEALNLSAGQKVLIIYGRETRVVPDNSGT